MSVCPSVGDDRTMHWKTDVHPPEELCSGNQVTAGDIGSRKPVNEVNHLRLEFSVGIGQDYVSVQPTVSSFKVSGV